MSLTLEQQLFREALMNYFYGDKTAEIPNNGFLSLQYINEISNAIDYNNKQPLQIYYNLYFNYEGEQISLIYFPFDLPSKYVPVPIGFRFTLENTYFAYYEDDNSKKRTLARANKTLKFAHINNYEPYFNITSSGKYIVYLATRKNHHLKPLKLFTKMIDIYPNVSALHNAFNIPIPEQNYNPDLPFWEQEPVKWSFSTGQNYYDSYISNCKQFRYQGGQLDGIQYVNPLGGFIFNDKIQQFWGGGFDKYSSYDENFELSSLGIPYNRNGFSPVPDLLNFHIPDTSRITGYGIYRGFDVVDITDTELLIKNKYLLIFRNRLDFNEYVNNNLKCCLLDCIKK